MERIIIEYFKTICYNYGRKTTDIRSFNYYNFPGKGPFFIFNLNTDKCTYFCSSIHKITGYHSHDYLYKGVVFFKTLIHPEDYSFFISELMTFIFHARGAVDHSITGDNIKDFSCRIRHKNGYWIRIALYVLYIDRSFDDHQNHIIGIVRKQKYAEGSKDDPAGHITKREKEVLQLIGNGDSSKIIADKLNISETTAISHRKNLIQKLHAKNTAELIKKAVKEHMID